jgi:hypothetical protein
MLPNGDLVAKEYATCASGTNTIYKFKNSIMRGLSIENKSSADMTVTVNFIDGTRLGPFTIACLSPAIWEEEFAPFISITYTSHGAFDLWGRD